MTTSSYSPLAQRVSPHSHHKTKLSVESLPSYSPHGQEKLVRRSLPPPWFTHFTLAVPVVKTPLLRVLVPNIRRIHYLCVSKFGRKRGSVFLCFGLALLVFAAFALAKRFGSHEKQWPTPFIGDPPTLVYKREDLQRIWQWEVGSGHYPSRESIPEQLHLRKPPNNPAIPPRKPLPSSSPFATFTNGTGSKRVYLDIQSRPPNVAYPPRPVPGSIADLDVVMEHCNFSRNKYVRDCLEVLRTGAGLDSGKRLRRGNMDDWKYIYVEHPEARSSSLSSDKTYSQRSLSQEANTEADGDEGLSKRRGVEWEVPPIPLPPTVPYVPYTSLPSPCDPTSPRIFHMFWTGPFTDKPYMALLSFLFTQNTGLHLADQSDYVGCRPQFWLWINPGPAASIPNPSATRDMFEQLKSSPWASPFLHPRFKEVIKFKLWNTTEQLDGVPELKDHWRGVNTLFNSGGQVFGVQPKRKQSQSDKNSAASLLLASANVEDDDLVNRAGSKSSNSYDRMSVILSDMARFILCHRFGGIYLDADTIFLRDWEELWGWKGAFAYRWSRLEKYNTAVLHLNKGSALGTFLFKTALKNSLDFHPMTVSRYTKEAYLEGLLLRLPDALFDSAWLNTEYYQTDRPPQPFIADFEHFFDTPVLQSAAPQALGFDGFYKGAYSYHFHNFWWKPFDPSRHWPDLGPRFADGERVARALLNVGGLNSTSGAAADYGDAVEDDKSDLDWSTVLKRTFEAYLRGERPSMYGEWMHW